MSKCSEWNIRSELRKLKHIKDEKRFTKIIDILHVKVNKFKVGESRTPYTP